MASRSTALPSARGRLEALRTSARVGRLRARLPRYAFLAFVVVMCAAGVRATIAPLAPAPSPSGGGPRVDFAEQSFAMAFARAYLSYEGSRPEAREAALTPFGSSSMDLGAGFTPPASGSQRVVWADVAQVQRPLAGGVIITVAAKLSSRAQPVYLSVPVERERGGAIYLDGYPAFVGPPLSTERSSERETGSAVSDGEVLGLIERALGNYLAGDAENLSADLAAAATVTLPPNPLRLQGIRQLDWVAGDGGGAVIATLDADDARGGAYTLRYEVGVRRVRASDPQIGPGWRVTYVQTISQQG